MSIYTLVFINLYWNLKYSTIIYSKNTEDFDRLDSSNAKTPVEGERKTASPRVENKVRRNAVFVHLA